MCTCVYLLIPIAYCQPTPQVQPHHWEIPSGLPPLGRGLGILPPPWAHARAGKAWERERGSIHSAWVATCQHQRARPTELQLNCFPKHKTPTHSVWFHSKGLIDTQLVIRGAPQKVHYLWPRVSVPLISRPVVTTWWGGTTPFSKEPSNLPYIAVVVSTVLCIYTGGYSTGCLYRLL